MIRLLLSLPLLLLLWPISAMASVCAHTAELAPPRSSGELSRSAYFAVPGAETLGRLGSARQPGVTEREAHGGAPGQKQPAFAATAGELESACCARPEIWLLPVRLEHVPYLPTAPPARS
jgi:hypothetical protein